MAMQFNLPPAGTTLNANTALDNLRLGYMVDRFTGLAIDRTIAGQNTDVTTVTGSTNTVRVTINSSRRVTTPGSYHISDRIIELTGAGSELLAGGGGGTETLVNGVHISFYNCTFLVNGYDTGAAGTRDLLFAFGITANAGTNTGPNGRGASARVADGVGNTRSINFYGCTVSVTDIGSRGAIRFQLADSIGSDFRVAGEGISGADINLIPSPQRGGRWINTRFVAGQQRSNLTFLQTYGFPDVYENVELYGFGFDNGVEADSAGPRMLVEPNYTLLGQQNIYTIQGNARTPQLTGQSQILQNVGFFTPPDNDDNADGDVITFRGATPGYVDVQNGGGGCINYAAYQPTYRDAITGTGIQNVRVRVNSSIGINAPTTPTTQDSFRNKLLRPGDTQTIGTSFIGNEYVTNTNGMLTTSRYTLDGWTTPQDGYFDPMIFHSRGPQNSSILASNDLITPNLNPPLNTALAVIQDIRGTSAADLTFTRHEAQYEAFSWSHDILQELSETSTTLFDDSTRATSTAYGINTDVSVTTPSVVGTLVKSSVTNSDNTPNLTALQGLFDQDDIPSINDMRMAYRYERYQFNVNGNPQTSLLDIVVDNDQDIPWAITSSSNIDIISIRGAGLTAKSDDLYTSDVNISTLNMNGLPISGLTLGSRSVANAEGITLFEELRHSDTLPAASNSTLIGEYIVQPAGSTVDITFDNCNLSQLDLLPTAGTTVNVRGTDNNGVALSASSFMSTGTLGTVNFPAPVVELTVETPDEPGTFGVIEVTGTSQTARIIRQAAIRTGGGTVGRYTIPADNMTTHRFYWKRDNEQDRTGVEGTGYATTIIERSNTGLTASTTETMVASPYFDSLYSGDPALGSGVAAAPSEYPDPTNPSGFRTRAFDNNGMQVQVNNERTTTGGPSQYHMLTAMDSTTYLNVLLNNNWLVDVITPTSVSSVNADSQFIQVNTRNAGRQQQLAGVDFVNPISGLEEVWDRHDLAFVDNLLSLQTTSRFYLRDDTDILLDDERWPGSGIGADPIDGYRVIIVTGTEDPTNPIIQTIRDIIGRFTTAQLREITGEISIFNSASVRRARYTFEGLSLTDDDEIRINLSSYVDVGSTGTLTSQGISAGNTTIEFAGFSRTAEQSDQVVPLTLGSTTVPSVILFPNPDGATPGQIQQAATNALNNSTTIAETRNGVGYLIGQGGDSRLIGIKPRATNYDSNTDYSGNL